MMKKKNELQNDIKQKRHYDDLSLVSQSYNTIQYNTIQYSAIHYTLYTVQYTIQIIQYRLYNTVRYSTHYIIQYTLYNTVHTL